MNSSKLLHPRVVVKTGVIALRTLRRDPAAFGRIARAFAANPLLTVRALPSDLQQKYRLRQQYAKSDWDDSWYEHFHELLGAPWPCPEAERVPALLEDIGALLTSKGLGTGRHTYGWYSDADISRCQAFWCAIRHARPSAVLETGVAHGVSSRVALEAFALNDLGHLWSIDLPHPLNLGLHPTTGSAVPDSCRGRWTYLEGESRRRLPPLVAEVGQVQLFIHDSLHTADNTLFEMEQAASVMSPGGVMIIDDIKAHNGFATFAERHPEYRTLIGLTPDTLGGFGIAVKLASS